jgi:hypothetical protein
MSFVSNKFGQFTYFDAQLRHPGWQGKTVLDFGGNAGNILRTANSVIEEENYWCIDVSADGIAKGRQDFPRAHWILYDRYNLNFNPTGSRSVDIPSLEQAFDYILAYSVFTHVDVWEMDHLTGRLMSLLNAGGAFAFTFIDHNFHSWPDQYPGNNLMWRLDRMNLPGIENIAARTIEKVKDAAWFRLVGDGDIYLADESIPEPERYEGQDYHVFHTMEFMRQHFPAAEILPPANQEMQHCCVLRKDDRSKRRDNAAFSEAGTEL